MRRAREKSGGYHGCQGRRARLERWSWCCWSRSRGWKGVLCGGTRKVESVGRVKRADGGKDGTDHDGRSVNRDCS